MRFLTDLALTISLLYGGGYATSKIYFKIKKVTLTKIAEGLPSLNAYTKKLTIKKSSEFLSGKKLETN